MLTKNPYEVLGVSPQATDDEIKKVYRELLRKYHPDSNVNNPLADLAAEKFKEVQEAYEAIMNERTASGQGYGASGSYRAGGYGASGSYGAGGYSSSGGSQDVRMQAVVNFINSGRYREALNLLDEMPQKDAMWYYASGCANAGLGNQIVAREHAAMAVNMDPSNLQYRQLLNQLEFAGRTYRSNPYGGYPGGGSSCGTGNLCCDLWCADTLCECMGGDLCSCM